MGCKKLSCFDKTPSPLGRNVQHHSQRKVWCQQGREGVNTLFMENREGRIHGDTEGLKACRRGELVCPVAEGSESMRFMDVEGEGATDASHRLTAETRQTLHVCEALDHFSSKQTFPNNQRMLAVLHLAM